MGESPKNHTGKNTSLAVVPTTMIGEVDSEPFNWLAYTDPAQATALMTVWPSHFPAACPPIEARPAEMNVFRMVASSPPTKEDFMSHVDANKPYNSAEQCRACGLSVYTDLKDAKTARKRFKPLRGLLIARGSITSNDGVVLQTSTPASHYTWWVKTSTPEASFSEIEPE